MKRLPDEKPDTLALFEGSGSYNCVYRTSGERNTVVRVASSRVLTKEERAKGYETPLDDLKRGVVISYIVSQLSHIAGPACLQVLDNAAEGPYELIRTRFTDNDVRVLMECANFREAVEGRNKLTRFVVQEVEYLNGGDLSKLNRPLVTEEFAFIVFSLIWYFYSLESEIGLYHGDFKPDNTGIRNFKEPQEYSFSIEGKTDFVFFTTVCPVVIDFDFSYVETSRNKPARIGTWFTAPPEYLKEDVETMDPHTYDWWSLGVTILDLFLRNRADLLRMITESSLPAKDQRSFYHLSLAINGLVTGNSYGPMSRTPTHRVAQRHIDGTMDGHLRHLLIKLLSLDPDERNMGGNPWLHLYSLYFARYRREPSKDRPAMYTHARYPILEMGAPHYVQDVQEFYARQVAKISLDRIPLLATCINCSANEVKYKCKTCSGRYCGAKCKTCAC